MAKKNFKFIQQQKAEAQFNPAQKSAASSRDGQFAVLAAPGSGKTAVIVARYRALLSDGVASESILSLTFTVEAAKEMRLRAGLPAVVEDTEGRPHGFMTCHSIAYKFALREASNFPFRIHAGFPLLEGGAWVKVIGNAIRPYRLDFRQFTQWMSIQKMNGLRPQKAYENASSGVEQNMAQAYRDYESACRSAGRLDFDSLLIEMATLLHKNENVAARWQYEFVQTDESQDLDKVQWAIVRGLSKQHGNVFSVGDSNQAIYAWRGAAPEMFLNFKEQFPAARELYLGINYRSTPEIVEFCRTVAPVKNELLNHFQAAKTSGAAVCLLKMADEQEEAETVVEYIQHAPPPIAVLARTNRQLRLFEDLLMQKGIEYHLLGKSGYWSQKEVLTVMAFIQLAAGLHPDMAVIRAIRAPFQCSRFIKGKEDALKEMQRETKETGTSLWSLMTNRTALQNLYGVIRSLSRWGHQPCPEAVKNIINDLGALSYYGDEEDSPTAVDNSPKENIEELIKIAGRFETLADLVEHDKKVRAKTRGKKGVALSTVHQAKGKEWSTVFVVGVQEDKMPHKRGDIEEEERTFFVAVSRPADRLILTHSGTLSRFVPKTGVVHGDPSPPVVSAPSTGNRDDEQLRLGVS